MSDEDMSVYRNSRLNWLAAAAFFVVVLCLVFIAFNWIEDEFAKNALLLILGRFLGYVDAVYNFEFGTTRGSKAKDETINRLSPTPGNVVPGGPIKTDKVEIETTNTTITKDKE